MKNKKIIIISLVLIVLVIIGSLGLKLYLKKDLENQKQDLENTYKKYGWVEKETVNNIVAKFNTKILDNGLSTVASDNYMTIENNIYWYALTDNIYYYLEPITLSQNKENDIVNKNGLYFKKDNYNKDTALQYVKLLIQANTEELTTEQLTTEEIDNLIKEAQDKALSNKSANNGKGISLSFLESDNHYEYQVVRLYR